MKVDVTRLKIWIWILIVLFITQSIYTNAQSSELRIIIKFTDNVKQPDHHIFVRQLSETANISLIYIKELSAHRNTHLYQTTLLNEALTDDEIIKTLSQRGDVIYAEKNVTYQLNTD